MTTDQDSYAYPPPGPCRKCGELDAFSRHDPRYEVGPSRKGRARLAWACSRCMYEVYTPTLDPADAPSDD